MNNETELTRYVFDLTLLCAEPLRKQCGGDDKEVYKIILSWAKDFGEIATALTEEDRLQWDYLLAIDNFAQDKLGNDKYWPVVRLLSRIMDNNPTAGHSEDLKLPILGQAIAMVVNQDNKKGILLCSDFHSQWNKSVLIPESQFDEPARVLEAVTWFDKSNEK